MTRPELAPGILVDPDVESPCVETGSAVVDFVLISVLVSVIFLAVIQLAMAEHVRNTLVDCATDGARYGALADRTPQDGARRARQLIVMDLSERYATEVTAGRERFSGMDTVVVRIRSPLPVFGLLGPGRMLVVEGHAVPELS